MAKIRIGKSVSDNYTLWRYMSLDKLINLLETESLYFAPLVSYTKSDPFEGYLPEIAFEFLRGFSEESTVNWKEPIHKLRFLQNKLNRVVV
jgi:hypothetical protein